MKKHNLEFKETKVVPIEGLYSYHANIPMKDYYHVEFVKEELEQSPEIEDWSYYKWMVDHLQKFGEVFSVYKTEQDLKERAEMFKDLIHGMKENYQPVKSYVFSENTGRPQGGICAIEKNNKYYIVDGHHRVCVLYYLGYTQIEILIFKGKSEND